MSNYIFLYLIIINILAFYLMFLDKKKAKNKKWRIPEKNLILTSIIGGSIGMLLGMYTFHHKTKHIKFTLGVPVILIIQLLLTLYLSNI